MSGIEFNEEISDQSGEYEILICLPAGIFLSCFWHGLRRCVQFETL